MTACTHIIMCPLIRAGNVHPNHGAAYSRTWDAQGAWAVRHEPLCEPRPAVERAQYRGMQRSMGALRVENAADGSHGGSSARGPARPPRLPLPSPLAAAPPSCTASSLMRSTALFAVCVVSCRIYYKIFQGGWFRRRDDERDEELTTNHLRHAECASLPCSAPSA